MSNEILERPRVEAAKPRLGALWICSFTLGAGWAIGSGLGSYASGLRDWVVFGLIWFAAFFGVVSAAWLTSRRDLILRASQRIVEKKNESKKAEP